VVWIDSWPSKRAMTEVSMPACKLVRSGLPTVSNTSARKTARCGSCPRRCVFEVVPAVSSCLPVQQNSMTHRITCRNLALVHLPDLGFLVHDRLRSRRNRIRGPYGACLTSATECCIRCNSAHLEPPKSTLSQSNKTMTSAGHSSTVQRASGARSSVTVPPHVLRSGGCRACGGGGAVSWLARDLASAMQPARSPMAGLRVVTVSPSSRSMSAHPPRQMTR
jgi:hypothetical protein